MKITVSTQNLIMTNQGWLSPYDIDKNKNEIKILAETKEGKKFVEVKNIDQKGKGKPFICKGHGHPELFLVKKDNSIYATSYDRAWDNDIKKSIRDFSEPKFEKASSIKGKFWASPINIAVNDSKYQSPLENNAEDFWFIGYYLGCGRKDGKEICVPCKIEDSKQFEEKLEKLGMFFKKVPFGTFSEYFIANKKWTEFLFRVFPKTSWKITVPYWIFTIDTKCKEALFNGYIDAIGTRLDKKQKVTIKDKGIAFTMKIIAQEIGYSVGIYLGKASTGNQSWQLVAEESARSSVVVGEYRYGLIRESKEAKDRLMNFWELEIDDCKGIFVDSILIK